MTLAEGVLPRAVSRLDGIERMREGGREREGMVGLDRNERLGPLPEQVIEEIRGRIDSDLLTRYTSTDRLYDQVAGTLGVERERLLLTPGSDAAMRALATCYLEPGDAAVMVRPSYAMYPIYTAMMGGSAREIDVRDDRSIDAEALAAAVTADTKLIFLATPNQPTGTDLGEQGIRLVLERATAARALVVADEAYFPFSARTVLPLVDEYPNLVVTRTFSKAWGLAGLRLGVVVAHGAVVRVLYKVRTAYDVNAAAAVAATVLLAHPEVASGYAAEVAAGRDALAGRLRPLGLEPLPSLTNFMLIDVRSRCAPDSLVPALAQRGWTVKGPFEHASLRDCIRVTLGPPALMLEFADALEETLGALD